MLEARERGVDPGHQGADGVQEARVAPAVIRPGDAVEPGQQPRLAHLAGHVDPRPAEQPRGGQGGVVRGCLAQRRVLQVEDGGVGVRPVQLQEDAPAVLGVEPVVAVELARQRARRGSEAERVMCDAFGLGFPVGLHEP